MRSRAVFFRVFFVVVDLVCVFVGRLFAVSRGVVFVLVVVCYFVGRVWGFGRVAFAFDVRRGGKFVTFRVFFASFSRVDCALFFAWAS